MDATMSMLAPPQIPNGATLDPATAHDKEQAVDQPAPRPAKQRTGGVKRSKPEDGSHPVLHYMEGQPLQWKDLEEGHTLAEVHVSKDSMSNTNNLVRSRQLWGNEVYTQDSDLLAVLMHQGFFNQQVPFGIQEVCCLLRLQPPATSYASCARNGIRSRAWGPSSESSFQVERCWAVGTHGSTVDLTPSLDGATSVVPTFAPTLMDRPMHTRAASNAPERRQRSVQEVTVQFNLCMEPWLKYAMHLVADQGLQRSQWTSARLLREVLYVETNRARYELSWQDPASKAATQQAHPANGNVPAQEQYRWAKCREPLPQAMMRKLGIPLPTSALGDLEPDVLWETFKWGPAGMYLHGKLYHIQRLHFTARRSPPSADRGPQPAPAQRLAPSAERVLGHQL